MILWEAVPQRKSLSYQNLGDQNHCLSVDIIVLLSSLVDTGSLIVEGGIMLLVCHVMLFLSSLPAC